MVDLAALLLRDYQVNDRRSVERARDALAHLGRYFDAVDPAHCYDQTMRYIIRRRGSGAAPATIRYEMAIFGRSLTLAARTGLIASRPFIARPKVRNARRGFFSPAELIRLLPRLEQPIRDATLFAYVTGWRRAEVFGLTWDRVDFQTGAGVPVRGASEAEPDAWPPFGGAEAWAAGVRAGAWRAGRDFRCAVE
jgi:integrase